MKILTWNINGIRAVKGHLKETLDCLDADVICIQETKVTRDMLDEPSAVVEGYNSYFAFSRKRSGYSGVATFCRDSATPVKAEEGLYSQLSSKLDHTVGCYGNVSEFDDDELEALDAEGRAVITQHKIRKKDGTEALLSILNVYCPRVDPEREDRHLYKLRFFALLQTRAEELLKSGSHVIVLGDINTKHKKIDHCDPGDDQEFYNQPSRMWLNQFLWELDQEPKITSISCKEEFAATTTQVEGGMFADSLRYLYPDQTDAYTNWQTLTNARETNYGCRLDYIFTDSKLTESDLKECKIMVEVMGSDHCPVVAEYSAEFIPNDKCPGLCTKFMPEFTGKQQKLSNFFSKRKECNSSQSENSLNELSSKKGIPQSDQNSSDNIVVKSAVMEHKNDKSGSKKRPLSSDSKSTNPVKKQKCDTNSSRQANLMNFFSQPKVTSQKSVQNKEDKDNSNKAMQTSVTEESNVASSHTTVQKSAQSNANQSSAWKNLLQGPPPAPLCKGHNDPCVLRTVKKPGPNKGKQFFVCSHPEGASNNPDARCDFFKWVDYKKK